jgi:RNA polymerase sigma factor (sigma-70 family)
MRRTALNRWASAGFTAKTNETSDRSHRCVIIGHLFQPAATATVTIASKRIPTVPIPTPSETDLVLDRLLADYGGFLRAAIRRVCPRSLGIHWDDIEQEARIRLWQALRRDCDIADPQSYLYRVVVTATIDAVRYVRSKREAPLGGAGLEQHNGTVTPPVPTVSGGSPEMAAIWEDMRQHTRMAIALLPENRRRALDLYLQGFTTQEIAELLGWTEPKARNLVHRGVKDLRRRFRRAA